MAVTHTPEGGIFIYGGLSVLFSCAIIRASYKRWKLRVRAPRADAVKFWKDVGGAMIFLLASLALLAIYIQEYRETLNH